jgi:hypothetical protein
LHGLAGADALKYIWTCRITDGIGVLVVGGADNEALAHALDESLEHLTPELGVVIHHKHVGESVTIIIISCWSDCTCCE